MSRLRRLWRRYVLRKRTAGDIVREKERARR